MTDKAPVTVEHYVAEKFWEKVDKAGPSECWIWKGYIVNKRKYSPDGYGRFYIRLNGKDEQFPAHRMAYMIEKGEIPEGLVIDHLCRKTDCVNPAHLEAVTYKENTVRGISPVARLIGRTHCKHGHEFTDQNSIYRKDNKSGRPIRICRECETAKWKRQYERRKVAALEGRGS